MSNKFLVMPEGWKMSIRAINGKDGNPAVIRIAIGHTDIETHAILEQPISAIADGLSLDISKLMSIALGIGSEKA